MRICVFGAGSVGGNLAVRLARAGAEVSVVARGAHLQAIRRDGLTLRAPEGEFVRRVAASDDPATLGVQDVVVSTLKTTGLAALAAGITPLLGPDTPVVFALNGIPWWYAHGLPAGARCPDLGFLDPAGALHAAVSTSRIAGGVIYSPNSVVAPGVIENGPGANQRLILGEPGGGAGEPLSRLAAMLVAGGIGAPVTPDIRREIWSKLLVNVANAPLSVLIGAGAEAVHADPTLSAMSDAVRRESTAVAEAHGITLDPAPWRRPASGKPGGGHKPSMLQDFELGRAPEIDSMLVALQAFARAGAVPTPTLDRLTALVAARATALGIYAGSPRPG
ncbi:MAG: 2-dehydropantoate 2-reductase [Alphaproteobacteria bacterium]|nr:2-dehydropantoate 2-reductase [Alphaproteobacteria bacterium]